MSKTSYLKKIAFADVVNQTIYFSPDNEAESLVLKLIDTKWFQRLRDITQTGNLSLVYMFAEHSRFGHSIGVAYLAKYLLDSLSQVSESEVAPYRTAILAAALLHDIGHIAPGSHLAFKTWFPGQVDCHEEIATQIISTDHAINTVLNSHSSNLAATISQILMEDPALPPWTWELISGGGWNVDRGNWCIVDSVLSGVSYGQYNIPALLEAISITSSGHLAVRENRLDAVMHFAVARHSMYRQLYQHRVYLASEAINMAVVQRARDLGTKLDFADKHARAVLEATTPTELRLDTIFHMRESWWRYHLLNWSESKDSILRDLASRLVNRRIFKTVRVADDQDLTAIRTKAEEAVRAAGYDPQYYLHLVNTADMHAGDSKQSMLVQLDDGSIKNLGEVEPLWSTLTTESNKTARRWLVMPAEAKIRLGRVR